MGREAGREDGRAGGWKAKFVIQMATVYHNPNAVVLESWWTGKVGGLNLREGKSLALGQFLGYRTPADQRVETNMIVQGATRAWRSGVEAFGGVAAGREGERDGGREEMERERGWEGGFA